MTTKECYQIYLDIRTHFEMDEFDYRVNHFREIEKEYKYEKKYFKTIIQVCSQKFTKQKFLLLCMCAAVQSKTRMFYPSDLIKGETHELYRESIRYLSNMEYHLNEYYNWIVDHKDGVYELYQKKKIPFVLLSVIYKWVDTPCQNAILMVKLKKFNAIFKKDYTEIRDQIESKT